MQRTIFHIILTLPLSYLARVSLFSKWEKSNGLLELYEPISLIERATPYYKMVHEV